MTRIVSLVLFASMAYPCLAQRCNGIGSSEAAIDVLRRFSPNATDSDSRECIQAAISAASQLRSKEAGPELVRYLSFHVDCRREEFEDIGVSSNRYVEGCEFPAVLALARIGPSPRPALLQVIESEESSSRIAENAAHALALSFMHDEDQNPGGSILFLRDAERSASKDAKRRIEAAVVFILRTEACKRFSSKCEYANRHSAAE